MSKAEDYILENMESGLITGWDDKNRPICQSWLTPDQARSAVGIAREEALLEVAAWINDTFIFSKQAKEDFSQTFNIMKELL